MNYLLGIDFGGGSSKAVLLDTSGNPAAESTMEYPTLHAKTEWCEQRPEDWIRALCANIKAVLETSGVSPEDILAVAVDAATHTWLMCGDDFQPVRPAVFWTDLRSRKQAEWLKNHEKAMIFRKTLHEPDTLWTLPQMMWMRENEPEHFSRFRHLFFEKDYIRFWLTGVWCTDTIEAQGSMLFDSEKGCWDEELMELAGVRKELLPPLVRPTDNAGYVTKAAADATGLAEGTPVICGATDTVMEILASGAVNPGDATVKLATAGRICVITNRPYPSPHLVNYSHVEPGLWYPGTATKAAAGSYRWFRDTFGGSYEELDELACAVGPGCDGLRYHPYLNGEMTPYADPLLCGSFIGIRGNHTKGHFARSVMEGVAFSMMHSREVLNELGISLPERAAMIGGGSKGALWRQITADCLGIELVSPVCSDSSLGSAMLAGVAAGVFSDFTEAVSRCVRAGDVTVPVPENTQIYGSIFQEYKAVHDALADIYHSRSRE